MASEPAGLHAVIHIGLYEPEIPPNTGNIIRLCANTGAQLHLIHPLGFELDDKRMRRAGLDYHEWANVTQHASLDALLAAVSVQRVLGITTKGAIAHTDVRYQSGDLLLFGPESRGLPDEVLSALPSTQRVRVPMRPGVRSLNLSNAVAVVVYEVWRQSGFDGAV